MVLSFIDITVFVEIKKVVSVYYQKKSTIKNTNNNKNFFVKFSLILY